jgi:hypothetical protein
MDQAGVTDYPTRILDMTYKRGRDTVKLPRISITKLMLLVAIIAANLAVGRVLGAYHLVLPVAIALTGLAVQAGAFALIQSRGRRRAFLAGFLVFGSMAMISVIWALVFTPNVSIAQDPSTGKMITIEIPGSLMWTIWSNYVEFVDACLAGHPQIQLDPLGIQVALIWFVPQFLIALTGGLLAMLIAGQWVIMRHTSNRSLHKQPGFTPWPL